METLLMLVFQLSRKTNVSLCFLCLQGTPALFLILLLLNNSMLVAYVEDKRSVPPSSLV